MNIFRSLFGRPTPNEVGDAVIASLIKSIKRDPKQEVAYIDLLAAYEKNADLDGAIAFLSGLVERKPRLDNPYRYLLVAYRRKGDLDGMKNLVALHYQNENAHQWCLVDAYTKGDWDSAITLLSMLVELHPREEKWGRYLVTAYDNKGDRDSAIAGLTKLIEACPVNNVLHDYLEECKKKASVDTVRVDGSDAATPQGAAAESRSIGFNSTPSSHKSKTEFEKNLELKTKLDEIDAQNRKQKRIEDELQFRPQRPLTSRQKFERIKPTGSRDGYSYK